MTAHRPHRPCPPHGWITSNPASRNASVSSMPVGATTVLLAGKNVMV
jgi:hypothetical protein